MKEYFSKQVKTPQNIGDLPQYIISPELIYREKEDEKPKFDIITLR